MENKKVCTYWLREYHAANSRQQLDNEEACEWPQGCKDYEAGKCPFHTLDQDTQRENNA